MTQFTFTSHLEIQDNNAGQALPVTGKQEIVN